MGPVKLDSARFSWKRDISVSTEFQTTLVCVDDSRSSEPPRTNRETLLSERQINVDTRVCIYIYIYIFTRCNGCRCIPRTHRRNGHHSNDEAISRCSISVLSHGKNLYSLFTSIPRFHPFSTGNCIAVLRTFEWRPLNYVKTRQDIPLVKQQNYPIIA